MTDYWFRVNECMLNIPFEQISKEERKEKKKNKMEENVLWRYQTPLED